MKILWNTMVTVQLENTTCPVCGVPFAFPVSLMEELQKTGDTFHCPSGHRLSFGNSLAAQLKASEKGRKAAEQRAQEAEQKAERNGNRAEWYEKVYKEEREAKTEAKQQLANTRRTLTNTKKRLANGTCPCCQRTFQNLQRHMNSQHPNYSTAEGA